MNRSNDILERHRSDNSIKDAYSRVAWFYNLWSSLTESRAARKVIELAAISDGEQILEVAVGTGLVFADIVRHNPNGFSMGIDLSPSMLSRAQRFLRHQPPQRYRLQIGSAYQIPCESNTVDLLINNFMMDLLPEEDFPAILSEYNRVLKPNGRIVVSTMTFGKNWYNAIWDFIASRLPSLLTGCRPVSIAPFLTTAGFGSIEVFYISQITFPSEVIRAGKRAPQLTLTKV